MMEIKKFPKITIDREKCTVPFLCKKCMQVCPNLVMQVRVVFKKQERLREADPRIDGMYKLSVERRDKCTVCNKCVEVCPVGALKIELPEAPTYQRR